MKLRLLKRGRGDKMNSKTQTRTQTRIKGIRRIPSATCILPQLRSEVEYCSHHFKVSRSFVIATALADYFGFDGEKFNSPRKQKRRG